MAEKSKLWYLENFNLLSGLDEDNMKKLSEITTMQNIGKNQPIYFAKEPSSSIFFLKNGRVKLTRNSTDGKEMILGIINKGEVFGELAYLDKEERTDYAIAMDEVLICAINIEEFKKFVDKNPDMNLRLNKLIGLRLRRYTEKIEDLVFKDSAQRIVAFILRLAEDNGKKLGDEIFIKPFLKHQEIAELTACSRQTVNAVLQELREAGDIEFDRKKLVIKNESGLKKN